MVRSLRGIHGLGIVFFLVLLFDHRRGHGGRADEGFGVTCLDEGLENLHLPLGQLDL